MTFFDAVDTAEFVDLVEEASPDSIVISRQTGTTSDGHGGTVENWTTVTTVNGKVMQRLALPSEGIAGGQILANAVVEITVPSGTDIKADDRATVGSQVYEVVGAAPRRSFEVRRRVYCRAIT